MKVFDCPQYSSAWWKARVGIPTASNFHRIITPKKWEYAAGAKTYIHELIADMHDPQYAMEEQYVSDAMAHGSYLEPEARRFYEFSQGQKVQEVGFITNDRFGCSPDGLVGDDGGLELKCPALKTHVKWLLDGVVPAEHLAQCAGFLVVTGRTWVDFMSYCPPLPNLLLRITIEEKTVSLRTCLDQFWEDYTHAVSKIEQIKEAG